jgi:hypothetical protein
VVRDLEGIHRGGIPLLFKIELQGDFSPMYSLRISDHQIGPKGLYHRRGLKKHVCNINACL